MAAQRQVPGGVYVNETTARQQQIPGDRYINQVDPSSLIGPHKLKAIVDLRKPSIGYVLGLAMSSIGAVNELT